MRPSRILSSLAFAILLASFTAQAAIITLSSPTSVTVGNSVDVDMSIDLDPGETLYAYQVSVTFPLFLQATSVTELGYFATHSVGGVPTIDNTGGVVSMFSTLSGSDALTVDDWLFRITFDTVAAGSGTVDFEPSLLILLDKDIADLPVSAMTPGSVKASEVPEPATVLSISAGLAVLLWTRARRRSHFPLQPAPRE